MAAYWIAHVTVSDDEAYSRYARIATEAISAHGGEFLARGGKYRQFEGNERPRHVVARFPTFEAAEACYLSPQYQEAASIAKSASERDLVIVEGV
jgi:uncharacterized protein (DUF1330 family)